MRPTFSMVRSSTNRYQEVLVVAALAVLAVVPFQSSGLRFGIALLYVALMSHALGSRYFFLTRYELSMIGGFMLLFGYYAVAGSFFFYLAALTPAILITLTLVSPLLLLKRPRAIDLHRHWRLHHSIIPLLITLTAIAVLVFRGRTVASMVSPWLAIHPVIWYLFFAAVAAALLLSLKRVLNASAYIPLFAIFFGVSALVFPLGFGFDPFIHEASERLLEFTGTIQPKPLYYIGYYSIVVWLQLITALPLGTINQWVVPVLTAITLPLTIVGAMRYASREQAYALTIPVLLLLLPLGDLTQSTPLSFALLWMILLTLLAIVRLTVRAVPFWTLILIAATALVVHPLVGVPACIFVVLLWLSERTRRNAVLTAGFFLLMSLAVPALLVVAGSRSPEFATRIQFQNYSSLLQPLFGPIYRMNHIDDLLYSYANNTLLILALLFLAGLAAFQKIKIRWHQPFLLASSALLVSYALTTLFVEFDFATAGEQRTFSLRLLTLACITAFPLIASGYVSLLARAKKSAAAVMIIVLMTAAASTASWYLSYPRFDTRFQYKGYSPSMSDYEAIHWIRRDSQQSPYIVLANQTVSAVAVKEFGFAHYYRGFFYYPLPTNGILYQQFLALMREPQSAESVLAEVRARTGVNRIYVVLNAYWDNAASIAASLDAAKAFSPDGVSVYRFDTP